MSLKDFEKYLGSEEETVVLTGGGAFGLPIGNVAPWNAGDMYLVNGYGAHDILVKEGLTPDGFRKGMAKEDGSPSWHWCYYRPVHYKNAQAAMEIVNPNNNFGPQLIYQVATAVPSILNMSAETQEAFKSPEIVYDIPRGSASGKTARIPYHFVWLPSVVVAVAKALGYAVPDFGFSDLTNTREFTPDEELAIKLFGDGDDFDNSVAFLQRQAIWEALGEKVVFASQPMGAKNAKGVVAKDSTTSEKLSECLAIATRPWKGIYASIGNIADPRPDKKGTDRVGRFTVCSRMFDDKEAAVAYVEGLKAARTARESATVPTPAYPSSWVDMQDEFESAFGSSLTSGKSKPAVMKELDISGQDYDAWKNYLGL